MSSCRLFASIFNPKPPLNSTKIQTIFPSVYMCVSATNRSLLWSIIISELKQKICLLEKTYYTKYSISFFSIFTHFLFKFILEEEVLKDDTIKHVNRNQVKPTQPHIRNQPTTFIKHFYDLKRRRSNQF